MLRILAIDDSKAVHAFLDISLKGKAVQVTHAFDGRDGLNKLAAGNHEFDIIFLDWEMPVMDGPTTLENLKTAANKIPVLMVTTKNNPDDIVRVLELGAVEYMLKPFTKDILLDKIRQAIGQDLANAA